MTPRCTKPLLALATSALLLGSCAAVMDYSNAAWDYLGFSGTRSGSTLNGAQDGPWVYRYDNGQVAREGEYASDKQVGEWRAYYRNGSPKYVGSFDAEGYRSGLWTYWHESGQRRAQGHYEDGREEGLWSFWQESGTLESQGDYQAGRQALRWSYFHPNSNPRAEGYYLDGQKVGVWRYWSQSGGLSGESAYDVPSGWEIVREDWPNGSVRREGFLYQGQPEGRWASWRENGTRKLSGDMHEGQPEGEWIAVRSDGELAAVAQVSGGSARDVEVLGDTEMPSAPDPDMDAATTAPADFLAQELVAIAAPTQANAVVREQASGPAPNQAEVLAVEVKREAPIEAQPWTVREDEEMAAILESYRSGTNTSGRRRSSRYASSGRGNPRRNDLEGNPLPRTAFITAENRLINLADLRGKKVVVVVLRGSVGRGREVCVYCTAQTRTLAERQGEFENLNTEVVLVYPGPASGLGAFREAYASISSELRTIPYYLVQDVGEQLVEELSIVGDLAQPTTLILDEQGIVRWAYEGVTIDDRPSAEELLELVRDLE